jgi:HEAT repeat protein
MGQRLRRRLTAGNLAVLVLAGSLAARALVPADAGTPPAAPAEVTPAVDAVPVTPPPAEEETTPRALVASPVTFLSSPAPARRQKEPPTAVPVPAAAPAPAQPPAPEVAAAPKAEKPAAPGPARRAFKRHDDSTEDALRKQLAAVPEVGLGVTAPTVMAVYMDDFRAGPTDLGLHRWREPSLLLAVRPDVGRLPVRTGHDCRIEEREARTLDALSRKLRIYLNAAAPPGPDGSRPTTLLEQTLRVEKRGKRPEWLRAEAIPTLLQLLMHEDAPVRLMLVELLAEIPGRKATAALAQRAVFDLDAENRAAAVEALRGRSAMDYRPVLLKALRYPWAAAADHAAEALAALGDRDAVPTLVTLLKQPNPAGPRSPTSSAVREVVRANHLTNCLLCHPPSADGSEPVLGVDPVLTYPSPTPQVTAAVGRQGVGAHNYGNRGGSSAGTSSVQIPLLVRGDVTYLRQDFSVQQPVLEAAAGAAAPRLRFDYVVRTRQMSRAERARMKARAADRASYPQREAVLFALRELTGEDAGPTTEAWLARFPGAEVNAEAERLGRKLVAASPNTRERLLAQYRDAKGLAYTLAIAQAIPELPEPAQDKAREALASRMARMTPDTLRDKLQDEDPEVRRAAAIACGGRQDAGLVPDLIGLLEDAEPPVARQAEATLRTLTGQELEGPAAWRQWQRDRAARPPHAGG